MPHRSTDTVLTASWMQYHSAAQDIDNLFNVTSSLASSINFNQMTLHLRSVFANLQDTMKYLWTISTHTMDYIDAATSGKLSPPHLASCRPTTDAATHHCHPGHQLYTYLFHQWTPCTSTGTCVHMSLIENKQFLLLIDIPHPGQSPTDHHSPSSYSGYPTWKLFQPAIDIDTQYLESPQMPQWDWNYLLHNLNYVNRPMDSSATLPHPFNLWLTHQHASLRCMPKARQT